MINENQIAVFKAIKAADEMNENVTAADIAERTGLAVNSVGGIITRAFQSKGYTKRVSAELIMDDGSTKAVNFIKLTDAGKEFDIDEAYAAYQAEVAAKEQERQARIAAKAAAKAAAAE